MGLYQYVRALYKDPKEFLGELYKQRIQQWRREPPIVEVERPTRIDRARALGYKPLPGIKIVRVRVRKGTRKREEIKGGRRPKAEYRIRPLGVNLQWIAEERANRLHRNMEVLGSYWVGEDGLYKWYEVILVDPFNPNIYNRPEYVWLLQKNQRGRVFRGKTSSARKFRGLRNGGLGAEKVRPSKRANFKD
ncbi:NEQ181 [Nanoarchaeum equitans Kin4-M]|uniref:Large ribosomal subunit protein eL15 n=1 Tax=Nanoarchaeum equitans (strain Kin4-M) TaxID=228908 RepID=RL15E_NANEQ|nr:RecName: Full=Large ribosomal subunit protein eL15; AltName: Full=50S ribosomal protein L15e [Nanoarchaeum equitans Kin4-M]AAR39036.1 NEQ181 [Nanoarchaeum equitans Kin4-M]